LDGDVTVFGKLTYLEVRNREIFEQNLPGYALTAEERQAIADKTRRAS
jgi:hypothetical protein